MSSSLFRSAQNNLNSYSSFGNQQEEEEPEAAVMEQPKEGSLFERTQQKVYGQGERPQEPDEQGFWADLKKFVTASEPNALEQGLGRALGLAGRGVAKAAGMPADLISLVKDLSENVSASALAGKKYDKIDEAVRKHSKAADQDKSRSERWGDFLKEYGAEGLTKKYDVATGGQFEPENILEHITQAIPEFLASAPAFEGKAALKGGNLLRNALSGVGFGAAQGAGAGAGGQLLGALAGGASLDILNPRNLKKGLAQAIGSASGKETNIPVRRAILEEGLQTAPPSLQTGSEFLKKSEKTSTQNPFAGSKFEENLSKVNNKIADTFLQKVGKGSQDIYEYAIKAGQSGQDYLNSIYKQTEDYFGKAYEGVKKKAQEWKTYPKNYAETLDNLETQLGKTLSESPEKASLLSDIREMKSKLGNREVGLEELLNTRADLNTVYNRIREFKGAQKFRKTFPQAINKDIEGLKATRPDVYEELKSLDKQYGAHKDAFNNKVIKAIRNEERPEVILGLIRQPSDYDKVAKILAGKPNGKKVLEGIKQGKLQQILSEQFLDARNGIFDYRRFKSLLDMPQINKWINKLSSPEQIKAIRNLEKIADGFTKGAKYLTKNEALVSKLKETGDIAQLGYMVSNAATGKWGNLAFSVLSRVGPRFLANMYTDPELIKIMLNTAKAGQSNNMKSYVNGMRKIAQRMIQVNEFGSEE